MKDVQVEPQTKKKPAIKEVKVEPVAVAQKIPEIKTSDTALKINESATSTLASPA